MQDRIGLEELRKHYNDWIDDSSTKLRNVLNGFIDSSGREGIYLSAFRLIREHFGDVIELPYEVVLKADKLEYPLNFDVRLLPDEESGKISIIFDDKEKPHED